MTDRDYKSTIEGVWDPGCTTYSYAGPNGDTLHIEIPEEIDKIQRGLKELGLYDGKIDGMFGEKNGGGLKNLITGMQEVAGAKPTGEYNPETRDLLKKSIDTAEQGGMDKEKIQTLREMQEAIEKLDTIKAPGRERDTVLDTIYNPKHYEADPGMCKDNLLLQMPQLDPEMKAELNRGAQAAPEPDKGGGVQAVTPDAGLAGRAAPDVPEAGQPDGLVERVYSNAAQEDIVTEKGPSGWEDRDIAGAGEGEKPEINQFGQGNPDIDFKGLTPVDRMPVLKSDGENVDNMPVIRRDSPDVDNMPVIGEGDRAVPQADGSNAFLAKADSAPYDVVAEGNIDTGWSLSAAFDKALAAVGIGLDSKPEAGATVTADSTRTYQGPTMA